MTPIRWNGEPISAPGVYSGVPMDAYHGQLTVEPSISSSGLRTIFDASPAHYYVDSYLNPERKPEEPSAAFVLGRAAHHLLLGEASFDRHFVIRPETLNGKPWQGARTECKDWLAAVADEGLTVVKGEQVAAIRGMHKSLSANPLVQAGILNGLVEHSLVWRDAETGVWIKARPDAIPTDAADFSDLKTTVSVDRAKLERTIGEYNYNVQAAVIGMASREVLGREMASFTLVFVEKAPPCSSRVVTLKPDDIALGERVVRCALRTFADCLASGQWPGPGGVQSDAEYLEILPWARTRTEGRLELMEKGVTV